MKKIIIGILLLNLISCSSSVTTNEEAKENAKKARLNRDRN